MKSYLTIVTLCFVLFIVVFVGGHLDTPGQADQDRSTLLGGGSSVGDRVAAIGQINVAVAKEESTSDEAEVASTEVTPTTPPAADGKQVYDAGCVACHGAGIAGAPGLGIQMHGPIVLAQDLKAWLQTRLMVFRAVRE